ncbi:AAA family ATPase [Nocardiopsis dassonvillei]
MSAFFRINALVLRTDTDPADRRDFKPGLNILTGPPGAGKSTMLELVRFGLGGTAQKTPVVEQHVHGVSVEIQTHKRELRLSREMATPGTVSVYDLDDQAHEGEFPVRLQGDGQPTIGAMLMKWLGIPHDAEVLVNGRPRTLGFQHLWEFIHIPQPEIDRSIARHDVSSLSKQRKRLFELLFGIYDPELQVLDQAISEIRKQHKEAVLRQEAVTSFLNSSPVRARADLQHDLARSRRRRDHLSSELEQLRSRTGAHSDRVVALRGLLSVSRTNTDELREAREQLERVQRRRRARLDRLEAELVRVQRVHSAGHLLHGIEFSTCPRCMQDLPEWRTDDDDCHLCRQPLPDSAARTRRSSERGGAEEQDRLPLVVEGEASAQEEQLAAESEEVRQLIDQGKRELAVLEGYREEVEEEVVALRQEIDDMVTTTASPRADELAATTKTLAQADADVSRAEEALRLWERVDTFAASAEVLEEQVSESEEKWRQRNLRAQATSWRLFEDLSQSYDGLLHAFGTPNVNRGRISPEDYLPYIDDKRFDHVNISGGNQVPFIVGYWLTLFTMALRNPDYRVPSCLILDTPQKSLGARQEISKRMYDRIQSIADENRDRLQIFLIDTDLPDGFTPSAEPEKVTYTRPAIASIRHPGATRVRTLEGEIPASDRESGTK